jgi:nitrate/TMAO reductase-like tetraheme cytochrome c subunit
MATAMLTSEAVAETGACLDCHSDYQASLDKTSHSQANKLVVVECSSCHIDYANHLNEPSSIADPIIQIS